MYQNFNPSKSGEFYFREIMSCVYLRFIGGLVFQLMCLISFFLDWFQVNRQKTNRAFKSLLTLIWVTAVTCCAAMTSKNILDHRSGKADLFCHYGGYQVPYSLGYKPGAFTWFLKWAYKDHFQLKTSVCSFYKASNDSFWQGLLTSRC